MDNDPDSPEQLKSTAAKLERQVRLLERKLARSEESRVLLEWPRIASTRSTPTW